MTSFLKGHARLEAQDHLNALNAWEPSLALTDRDVVRRPGNVGVTLRPEVVRALALRVQQGDLSPAAEAAIQHFAVRLLQAGEVPFEPEPGEEGVEVEAVEPAPVESEPEPEPVKEADAEVKAPAKKPAAKPKAPARKK